MTVAYQKERFEDIMDELPELFYAHYQEHDTEKDILPLDVDWMAFVKAELNRALHIMTVRKDGELIGYFFAFVKANFQSKKTILAASSQIYISSVENRGIIFRRLVLNTQKMVRDLGAKKLYIVVKAGSPAARLLRAMKIELTEETFSCRV